MLQENWIESTEGQTDFIINKDAERFYDRTVFYNPNMVINRDLALLQLYSIGKNFKKKLRILDPFAGSGIRSFRILNELPSSFIERVVLSDINPNSIETIEHNINKYNYRKAEVSKADAFVSISDFIQPKKYLDVIDLDPFGSPISFLELALRALYKTEGYLMLTATDMQVLCGKVPSACIRMYNAIPTNSYLCHEVALRILVYNLLVSAGRIGGTIKPIIAIQFEHFFRIHAQIVRSKEAANRQHTNIGFVYLCEKCVHFEYERMTENKDLHDCPFCGDKLEKIGPMWLGPLIDTHLISLMITDLEEMKLSNKDKIRKILIILEKESQLPPLFYSLPNLYKLYKKTGLSPDEIIRRLNKKGYKATRTIFDPQSIRTDAASSVLHKLVKDL